MSHVLMSTSDVLKRRRNRRLAERLGTSGVVAIIVIALLVLWQVAADRHWLNGQLFGTPVGVYQSAVVAFRGGTLVSDTLLTLSETVLGLIIGSGLGLGLGLMLWFFPRISKVSEGFAVLLNSVPKIALGPLIVIWFGSDMTSKVWLSAISTFAVAMISACAAAREVDQDLLNLFRSFHATPSVTFRKLILPGALSWIFSTLRVNIGFALIGAVVGEYIASQSGLGHAVFVAGSLFDLNTVWLGVIVLTLMASILTWIVQAFESKIISWKKKQ